LDVKNASQPDSEVAPVLPAGEAGSRIVQNNERSYRLLVNSVTDYAIYMLDPEGYVVSWNGGAQRIKQYASSEVIGQHYSIFYTEEDRQKGEPERALRIAQSEGKYEAEGWRVRKDG